MLLNDIILHFDENKAKTTFRLMSNVASIVVLFDIRSKIWYNKYMSKSKDLRETAVAYKKAGNSFEETGDLSNNPLNRSFKKIDPEKLKAYVAEHPDDTQEEVALVFRCCNQAINQAYRRLEITRKKDIILQRTKVLKK